MSGQIGIPIVVGPLGSSPDDLALILISSTDPKNFKDNPKTDPYTRIFPFDVKLYKEITSAKGFRIGYFESLRTIETTPASKRAVSEAVDAIRVLGHYPVSIHIPHER